MRERLLAVLRAIIACVAVLRRARWRVLGAGGLVALWCYPASQLGPDSELPVAAAVALVVPLTMLATARLDPGARRSDSVLRAMGGTFVAATTVWIVWRLADAIVAASDAEARSILGLLAWLLPHAIAVALFFMAMLLARSAVEHERGPASTAGRACITLALLVGLITFASIHPHPSVAYVIGHVVPRALRSEALCGLSLVGCVAITALACFVAHVRDPRSARAALAALALALAAIGAWSCGTLSEHFWIGWGSIPPSYDQMARQIDHEWARRPDHFLAALASASPALPVALVLLRRGWTQWVIGPLRVTIAASALVAIAFDTTDRTIEHRIERARAMLTPRTGLDFRVPDLALEDGALRAIDPGRSVEDAARGGAVVTFEPDATVDQLLRALPESNDGVCLARRLPRRFGGAPAPAFQHPRLRDLERVLLSCIRLGARPEGAVVLRVTDELDLLALERWADDLYGEDAREVVLSVPSDLELSLVARATERVWQPFVEIDDAAAPDADRPCPHTCEVVPTVSCEELLSAPGERGAAIVADADAVRWSRGDWLCDGAVRPLEFLSDPGRRAAELCGDRPDCDVRVCGTFDRSLRDAVTNLPIFTICEVTLDEDEL